MVFWLHCSSNCSGDPEFQPPPKKKTIAGALDAAVGAKM